MFKLLFLPVRLVLLGMRLAGVRGLFWLCVGVALGLVFAPQRGADLRARLRAELQAKVGGDVYPEDADLTL